MGGGQAGNVAPSGTRTALPRYTSKMFDAYPAAEWKLVYRLLHARITEEPDLLDSGFLSDLQTHLQRLARADGVDVGHHAAWDAWLGNGYVACDVRNAGRRMIG